MQFQLQQANMQQQQQFMMTMSMMMHSASAHPGMSATHREIPDYTSHNLPSKYHTFYKLPSEPILCVMTPNQMMKGR